MTFQAGPLSIAFTLSGQPAALISRAIARAEAVEGTRRQRWVDVLIPSMPGDTRETGSRDRLTLTEREFQRAVYRDERIHKPRKNSGGPWSLDVEWGPIPELPSLGRVMRVRVWSDTSGRRHVDRRVPRGEQWTRNASLQSGGIGSPKQRFPAS